MEYKPFLLRLRIFTFFVYRLYSIVHILCTNNIQSAKTIRSFFLYLSIKQKIFCLRIFMFAYIFSRFVVYFPCSMFKNDFKSFKLQKIFPFKFYLVKT